MRRLLGLLLLLASACGGAAPPVAQPPPGVLRFPIVADVNTLDPALVNDPLDTSMAQNLFGGLMRYDDHLAVVPEIATAAPEISSGGTLYTFHLRPSATFWDGTPVKASDFVYSWTRAIKLQGDFAYLLQPINGYDDVARGRSDTLTGALAVDAHTLRVRLRQPTPDWTRSLCLAPYWVVRQSFVELNRERWWDDPNTSVGSGPFRLTAHHPGRDISFERVQNWWGGSVNLASVQVDVVTDGAAQVQLYASGRYDLVGFAGNSVDPATAVAVQRDPVLSADLRILPGAATTWVAFDFASGPFAGNSAASRSLRRAFSLSIDRAALVKRACTSGIECVKATGGLIPPGYLGYRGDAWDSDARFDPVEARRALHDADPEGLATAGLTYAYNQDGVSDRVAHELQAQWLSNLGLRVGLDPHDRGSYFTSRAAHEFTIYRGSWQGDVNSPRYWYQYPFHTGSANNDTQFSDPVVDRALDHAAQLDPALAVDAYASVSDAIQDTDHAIAVLYYSATALLVKPYVTGAGQNNLTDYYWKDISVQR
ncbi:MAG: peptide ABC transporter substrate-binding protein [Candidatus Dormibacteria bacterium]